MACCGRRKKAVTYGADQNWSYINLNDFKSSSCWTPFAYGYVWFSLLLSIAVYGIDTFTAVNLLVFDDWSNRLDADNDDSFIIDRSISKWIFSACIIASFVNLGFEHVRAWRVMKRGNIAECYLDSLAVRLESVRMGKYQGWRRFLVFAALTKSKKGAEYIALFTYFSFQSWIRVLVCSGPRQVINGFTLYTVYTANLVDKEATTVDGSLIGFFKNIRTLAMENYQQAIILSGMTFTFVVWAFALLFLIAAILFYVFFLWHFIPKADGGLSGYCERKVNKALVGIVSAKVDKALFKGEAKRMNANLKAGEKPALARQATLPVLPDAVAGNGDQLPAMPSLQRTDTLSTLPPYVSRPNTPGGSFEMNTMDQKRPLPSRTGTMASGYSSRAPLMASASDMGTSSPLSPAPTLPSIDFNSQTPLSAQSSFSRNNGLGHLPNNSTSSSHAFDRRPSDAGSAFGSGPGPRYTETPVSYSGSLPPFPPPVRSPTTGPMDGYNRPPMPQQGSGYMQRSPTAVSPMDGFSSMDGRASPAPSAYSSRSGGGPGPGPRNPGQRPLNPGGFQAYQPSRSATGPLPQRGPQQPPPSRNMTMGDYPGRQQPSRGPGYSRDYDAEAQRDRNY